MFFCPKNIYNPHPLYGGIPTYRVSPMISYIRLLHASPKSPAVDVYINDMLKFRNLNYGAFTDYMEIVTGNYNVKVYAAGTKASPVLTKNIFVPPGRIYTAAAIGLLPNIDILPIPEPKVMEPTNNAYIKFAHLSPNAGAVDIALADGTILFKNISYKGFTNYIQVPAGTYTIEAKPTGTKTTVLYVPNVTLKPQRFYTVYAIGLINDRPGIQALIPLDGSSYLDLTED